MNSGIVFLEINEVPYRVLDYYVEKCPRSATASLMAESTQFVTFCNDEVELDPWISWPTLHRGVNDTAHGILRLGQILDNADKRYPPIWRILADHKVRVGLFGSVHSGHIPEDLTNYPFYVPDFFDDEVFAHPAHLLPFQRFNLGMTRRSARNVDAAVPFDLLKDFLRSLPSLGLSPKTALAIARQLLDERVQPRVKLRRRSMQGLLAADLYFDLVKRYRPAFSTYYTNHLAAAMHRYWAAAFPGDYETRVLPEEWFNDYSDEVFHALTTVDMILARAKKLCSSLNATLVVAGSMGQAAVTHDPIRHFLTMTNVTNFMGVLGVEPSDVRVRHAMVPSTGAVIPVDRVEEICAKLDSITINGRNFKRTVNEAAPLSYAVYDDGYISFFSYFGNSDGSGVATLGNQQFSLEEAGFTIMPNDDGVAVTAHHDPEGVLMVWHPDHGPLFSGRRNASTIEIAPAILARFGIDRPDYMVAPGDDLLKSFLAPESRLSAAN